MTHKDRFNRIAQAIVESKPKMVDGKAMYAGTHYESLDDAWDWFEDDLQAIKDIAEGFMDTTNQMIWLKK
jgi:spore maturation protein CgeB